MTRFVAKQDFANEFCAFRSSKDSIIRDESCTGGATDSATVDHHVRIFNGFDAPVFADERAVYDAKNALSFCHDGEGSYHFRVDHRELAGSIEVKRVRSRGTDRGFFEHSGS